MVMQWYSIGTILLFQLISCNISRHHHHLLSLVVACGAPSFIVAVALATLGDVGEDGAHAVEGRHYTTPSNDHQTLFSSVLVDHGGSIPEA